MKRIIIAAAICGLPFTAIAAGPPAPGTTQTTIKVKVRASCTAQWDPACPEIPSPNCSGDGPNCQPPPPADCTGPNGVGDCTPPGEDDDWIEEAIADGCEPIVEVDGDLEIECP